jgi:hypothetical protein
MALLSEACIALTTLLDDLLMAPDASSPNPFTGHGKECLDNVPESYWVTEQVQKDMCAAVHANADIN